MGMSFSTIQIQNRERVEPKQFRELLCRHIEKKDLLLSTKEDSHFSYHLAFSDNSEWVTLSSPNFEGTDIKTEMQKLAKAFKTVCIATNVFDSDIVLIYLFDSINKKEDTVVVGHEDGWVEAMMEAEGIESVRGNQECWESLLTTEKTWGELTQIWNDEYVFAEEALAKTAPFLGIDSKNITADYRCFEAEPGRFNVLDLHFKAAGEVFIKEGPTRLSLYPQSFPVAGERQTVSFCNLGGVSKGVTVLLLGECFRDDGVKINEMTVEKMKNPRSPETLRHGAGEREVHSAKVGNFEMPDGTAGLYFNFDDFQFHEGVNQKHPSIKGRNGDDIFFSHGCHLRFTPIKILAGKHYIRFVVIPQSNWELGQTSYKMALYDTYEQRAIESFEDFQHMEYTDPLLRSS